MKSDAITFFNKLSAQLLETLVSDAAGNNLTLNSGVEKAVALLKAAKDSGNKVMVIGNGGSAAIASHTQNDLCKAVGVQSLVFTETPLLTALSNDNGYETAYESQVDMWAAPGDILFAISSSGNSENILRSVTKAKAKNCKIITLSGFSEDNALRKTGEINFYAPADTYGSVELIHSVLTHFITDCASEE